MQFSTIFLSETTKPRAFYIWCITSSRGPLPLFGGQHKWSSVNGSTVTFSPFPQVSDSCFVLYWKYLFSSIAKMALISVLLYKQNDCTNENTEIIRVWKKVIYKNPYDK